MTYLRNLKVIGYVGIVDTLRAGWVGLRTWHPLPSLFIFRHYV